MATATLDPQLKVQLTKAFRDQFDPFRQENLFAGFGKITGTGQTTRTESNDTLSRKNITYAKLISPTDIAYVIDRVNWTSGTAYDEFDPSVDMSTKTFYVLNRDNNVFVCTTKGSGNSVNEPTLVDTVPEVMGDGYEWKFVARVTGDLEKFLNASYIPLKIVPYYSDLAPSSYEQTDEDIFQYTTQYEARQSVNNGKIQKVKISAGSDAVYSRVVLAGQNQEVQSSTATTTVLSTQASSVDDYYNGYGLKFNTGPRTGLFVAINDYDGASRTVTHASLGANANQNDKYEIRPIVAFAGDGSGATAMVSTNNAGNVDGIIMVNSGSNYKTATATISTSAASGSDPTLTPVIFKEVGQDPVFELFASAAKLYIRLESNDLGVMTQNDYSEIFIASDFEVGASYEDSGKLAGHDVSTLTRVDIQTVSGEPIPNNFAVVGDLLYGESSRSFGEISRLTKDGKAGHFNIKTIRGEYLKDEVLQVIDSTGTTLSVKNRDLKCVRTRLGDTTLTIPKQNWRGTHEVGVSFDNTPVIDTAVTGGSGGVGLIAEVKDLNSSAKTATVFLTQVYGAAASGTVDFTVEEKLTTTVGELTVKTISGPEINLDSGRMLYIEGITAVSREDEQEDVIEMVFDF